MNNYKKYNDQQLVSACLKGKRRAQEELFDRFSELVKGIGLRYLKSPDRAEDMVQETYIKIFQKLETYNFSGALGAWIRMISVNTALEVLRKKEILIFTQNENSIAESTDLSVFKKLEMEELITIIHKLPLGFRTVFNLYAIEGYTHKEIGEMLSISEGTSKSQYSRAKVELRNMIVIELKKEKNHAGIR